MVWWQYRELAHEWRTSPASRARPTREPLPGLCPADHEAACATGRVTPEKLARATALRKTGEVTLAVEVSRRALRAVTTSDQPRTWPLRRGWDGLARIVGPTGPSRGCPRNAR
jgi:hypothetical protein